MSAERLAENAVRLLKEKRLILSTAESFTGGRVGSKIVSVPGASEVFFEGINAYGERAKVIRLGVSEQTLREYGAVSMQTALEMAEGLIKQGNCDIALSTTGVAGPQSDGRGTPVGRCYLAVATREGATGRKCDFSGTREEVTRQAVEVALQLVCEAIK